MIAICPECSKKYRLPDTKVGIKFRCKKCSGVIDTNIVANRELEEPLPLVPEPAGAAVDSKEAVRITFARRRSVLKRLRESARSIRKGMPTLQQANLGAATAVAEPKPEIDRGADTVIKSPPEAAADATAVAVGVDATVVAPPPDTEIEKTVVASAPEAEAVVDLDDDISAAEEISVAPAGVVLDLDRSDDDSGDELLDDELFEDTPAEAPAAIDKLGTSNADDGEIDLDDEPAAVADAILTLDDEPSADEDSDDEIVLDVEPAAAVAVPQVAEAESLTLDDEDSADEIALDDDALLDEEPAAAVAVPQVAETESLTLDDEDSADEIALDDDALLDVEPAAAVAVPRVDIVDAVSDPTLLEDGAVDLSTESLGDPDDAEALQRVELLPDFGGGASASDSGAELLNDLHDAGLVDSDLLPDDVDDVAPDEDGFYDEAALSITDDADEEDLAEAESIPLAYAVDADNAGDEFDDFGAADDIDDEPLDRSLKAYCTECSAHFRLPLRYAGRTKLACAHCQSRIVVLREGKDYPEAVLTVSVTAEDLGADESEDEDDLDIDLNADLATLDDETAAVQDLDDDIDEDDDDSTADIDDESSDDLDEFDDLDSDLDDAELDDRP